MKPPLSFTDQMGNSVQLSAAPIRIISLVPSQTELLFDLGLNEEVVGVTKYCVHPSHWQAKKTIVGGTKNFNIDLISRLEPDLIIGNKEENVKEPILQLQEKYPVWMSDISNLEQALQMIEGVGLVVNRQERSKDIVAQIVKDFTSLKANTRKKVLYLIWRKPWMAAGQDTFINSMLDKVGLVNCLSEKSRYPELSSTAMKELAPDVVLLSSEPYPFKEKHIAELQSIFPRANVMLVDGEMFSWYGSRLLKAVAYLRTLSF